MNYDSMMSTQVSTHISTQMGTHIGAQPIPSGRTVDYLRQEIAFFESRLSEMGESGDCAYERALSNVFRTLLAERRSQLASLNQSVSRPSSKSSSKPS